MPASPKFSPIFLLLLLPFLVSSLTPNTYFEEEDKTRFLSLFKLSPPYTASNLVKIHYSLLGTSILTNGNIAAAIPTKEHASICNLLKEVLSDTVKLNVEDAYFAVASANLLNCKVQLSPALNKLLEGHLNKDDPSVSELHRAALSLQLLGRPLDSKALSKQLQAALKKDESLLSVGLAFQLAAKLSETESIPFAEKIGDVIVQADEVDGRYLQFEGGLGITANIIKGIYSLATVAKKPIGVTENQAIKFTNYFLNRKTVQTHKSAAELLEVLKLLEDNPHHIPVCVTLYNGAAVNNSNPVVTVKVTNVMGKSLGRDLKVSADSEVTGKVQLQPVQGDGTLFAVNLKSKARRGAYIVSLNVAPSKPDGRLIGNKDAKVKVIVLTEIALEKIEIGIVDNDQLTASKTTELQFLKFHSPLLEADHHQKLLLKFRIRDKISGDSMASHQAFVHFWNEETKQEIIFVAEPDSGNAEITYKFDMNLNTRAKDFAHKSGIYTMSLIVGDSVIANPFLWKVAAVKLSFPPGPETGKVDKAPWMVANYAVKPEIKHMFRQPEKRPAAVISDTFSILVCLPFVLLVGLWFKIGINLKNMPLSLSVIGFHAGLGSIFALFACFWLQLNMFTTLKYLLALGVITFLSGHSLLSTLANKRLENHQK